MNSSSRTSRRSTLALDAAAAHQLELDWAMVERPAVRPRFRNFPFADDLAPAESPLPNRTEKRPLAA